MSNPEKTVKHCIGIKIMLTTRIFVKISDMMSSEFFFFLKLTSDSGIMVDLTRYFLSYKK